MANTKLNWRPIKGISIEVPPGHVDLVFLCANKDLYKGRMCYGMHPPWYCANGVLMDKLMRAGIYNILNDHHVEVTHWIPFSELMEGING